MPVPHAPRGLLLLPDKFQLLLQLLLTFLTHMAPQVQLHCLLTSYWLLLQLSAALPALDQLQLLEGEAGLCLFLTLLPQPPPDS